MIHPANRSTKPALCTVSLILVF